MNEYRVRVYLPVCACVKVWGGGGGGKRPDLGVFGNDEVAVAALELQQARKT